MKSAVLTTVVGALFVGPACYGRSDLTALGSGDGTASIPAPDTELGDSKPTAQSSATQQDSSVECETAPRGAELWRYGLGEVDASEWTSVAVDRGGNAFASSPPLGTVKIGADGILEWSKPFGGVVVTGSNGKAYVLGTLPPGTALDSCAAGASTESSLYFEELDGNGDVLRCTAVGSAGDGALTGFAIDKDGNSIISGPGLGTTKLDDEGHAVWSRPLSGSVATDSEGNVIVAGALTGTAVFGDTTLESAGGEDVLIAKLNPGGDYVFVHSFGDAGPSQRGEGVTVDRSDNILVTGVSDGSIDFGAGTVRARPDACPEETWCEQAGFIVKFDSSGKHVWTRARFPVRSLRGIATDSSGDVLASGAFPGNAPPYRLPLLVEFDAAGTDIARPIRTASAVTDAGAGYAVAFDHCDNALWLVTAPPVPSEKTQAFLTKLAP